MSFIAKRHILAANAEEGSELRMSQRGGLFYGGISNSDEDENGLSHGQDHRNNVVTFDDTTAGKALDDDDDDDDVPMESEMVLTREISVFEVTPSEDDVLLAPPQVPIEPEVLERVEDPFEVQEKLGVLPFAAIIFYGVSGGPFGVEEAVRSAGNFYTLAGFLVMPYVWSLQEALMTAELGSTFPEASGGVAWVQEAFGDCAAWMCGYLHWVAGSTDNAIYPVLFVDYLLEVINGEAAPIPLPGPIKFLLLAGISCLLSYMNWLGLPLVGQMSLTISFVALSPFLVLSLVGAFEVHPSRWFEPPEIIEEQVQLHNVTTTSSTSSESSTIALFSMAALQRIAWRPFLNCLFWNLNNFDSAAPLVGDVDDPARTLPRAMGLSFFMVNSCYFIPLLVALGASAAKQSAWVDGYFSVVATKIAGRWLGGWLVFAAAISNIGLFQAQLSSVAFQLMGMAERGFLPKIFATRSWHGTPTYGILIGLVVIICMSMTDLAHLIEMLNFNYSLSLILEYFAFLQLRLSRPALDRPYRVPLNTLGCFIVFVPTLLTIGVIIALASWKTMMFGIAVNVIGLLIFFVREIKTWEPFTDRKPETQENVAVDHSTSGLISTGAQHDLKQQHDGHSFA